MQWFLIALFIQLQFKQLIESVSFCNLRLQPVMIQYNLDETTENLRLHL